MKVDVEKLRALHQAALAKGGHDVTVHSVDAGRYLEALDDALPALLDELVELRRERELLAAELEGVTAAALTARAALRGGSADVDEALVRFRAAESKWDALGCPRDGRATEAPKAPEGDGYLLGETGLLVGSCG